MALPPTEIYYSRYTALPFLLVGSFLIFVLTGLFYTSEKIPGGPLIYLGFAGGLIVLFFGWRWYFRQLKIKRPALTFHHDGLEIHKDGSFIAWERIVEWKITHNKSSDDLIIRTPEGKKRINVMPMDKSMSTIRELMKQYILRPGPHV